MTVKFGARLRASCNSISPRNSCPCRNFFECHEEHDSDFWKELGQRFPDCKCERSSVSRYSPGPVGDSESPLTVVTSDKYMNEGKVDATLFQSRISNGISTDRKDHTNKAEYDRRAENLVANSPNKTNCGSIEMSVSEIRKIYHQESRAIAVYDTALEENPAHADIVSTEIPPIGTPGRRKLLGKIRRNVLNSVLHNGHVLTSEEIFNSTPRSATGA